MNKTLPVSQVSVKLRPVKVNIQLAEKFPKRPSNNRLRLTKKLQTKK